MASRLGRNTGASSSTSSITVDAIESEDVVWQFRNDKDTGWSEMSSFYAKQHEDMYLQNITQFEYDVRSKRGNHSYHYRVCLVSMTQTNMTTNKVRTIRRLACKDTNMTPNKVRKIRHSGREEPQQ